MIFKDRNEHLSRLMIDLFEAFEEYDTAQFYRKGSEEWGAFVRKFNIALDLVRELDSRT